MQGTVKFYSKEKGYGFIFSSESEKDLFFGISDWKNPTVPEAGDDIEFDIKETKKGKQAVNIKLIKAQSVKKQEYFVKNDDRISCPSCGKKIVPRTITYKGRPQKTVCPYCSSVVKVLFSPIVLDTQLKLMSLGAFGLVAFVLYLIFGH